MISKHSPTPKRNTLADSTRLSQPEMQSLRDDLKSASARAKELIAQRKAQKAA
jgi:hypothetical protein